MTKSSAPSLHPSGTESGQSCVAVIGDLVASRRFVGDVRGAVQQRLAELLEQINEQFRDAVLSRFLITIGDEFQGLLRRADVVPDVVWEIETGFGEASVRFGIGYGTLDTPVRETAIGMDGPVFHAARQAIESADATRRHGGVFRGFGEREDRILDGLAELLHHQRTELTAKQLAVLRQLHEGHTQVEVARALRLTKQTVNRHARSGGWDSYRAGEAAWRAALELFTDPRPHAGGAS